MTSRKILFNLTKERPLITLVVVIGVPILYYSILMVSLIVTFKDVPNYVNVYNWLANSVEILRSTPAFSDALTIISEEWLIEIGFMNYDYGFGISEWSLNIMPFKLMLAMLLAWLLLLNVRLYRFAKQNSTCGLSKPWLRSGVAAGGLGSVMVGAASMTMFWVVCCASPSWVVGLAMLGLVSVSAALALDPLETYVLVAGFIFMLISSGVLLHLCSAAIKQQEDLNASAKSLTMRREAHA